jgi:hypothetical protein
MRRPGTATLLLLHPGEVMPLLVEHLLFSYREGAPSKALPCGQGHHNDRRLVPWPVAVRCCSGPVLSQVPGYKV